MATLAETVTRICDDLSRPEDEIGDVVQREILSAVKFYENRRFGFNERILTPTLSATYSYAFSALLANDTDVADILSIDEMKVTHGGNEYEVEHLDWSRMFELDPIDVQSTPPDFWSVFNKSLRVYPTPTTSISAQITAHVKLVSVEDGENAWLTEGEDLIRSRATKNVLARKLDDFEKAQVYQGLEDQALRSVMHDAFVRRASGILAPNY